VARTARSAAGWKSWPSAARPKRGAVTSERVRLRASGGMDCFGHLAFRLRCPDHVARVATRRLPLDRETVDGIIRMLMAINAKLDRLLGEEEDDASEDES
jgi:hypothetical protein